MGPHLSLEQAGLVADRLIQVLTEKC